MRSKGFDGMTCSVADVLGAVGDRWGLLILRDLLLGLRRYDDLRKSTGITHATLSDRLKFLEENRLIERRKYQTRPDRFDYLLSAKGKDIALVIHALAQVGDKWDLAERRGPPLRFVHAASGRAVKLAPVDAESGAPVRAEDVRLAAGAGADDLMRWRLEKTLGAPATYTEQ
jgi:DNA-binding HxlR family transcriptional regulator